MDYKLECPICLEYFRMPKILPCGHTYCDYCLKSIIKDSELSCPECNQHHKDISIEKLPRNYILDKVIESHKNFDFELSNKLLNIELEEYPKEKKIKEKKIYENKEKEEKKLEEKKKKFKLQEKNIKYNKIKGHANEEFLNPRPIELLNQQGAGLYTIANSRFFQNICKCNFATIVFLIILNGLTVITGISFRFTIFLISTFNSYHISSCTTSILEWQLTWFLANLFMSIFSSYRIRWVTSKLSRVLTSLLFYPSAVIFAYLLVTGINESFYKSCGGKIQLLSIFEKLFFISEISFNLLLSLCYTLALILGLRMRIEYN